jgi:hypothetical protein
MRLISSRATFGYKWIFPIIWFGFLLIFTAYAMVAGFHSSFAYVLPMLAVAALLAVFGYLIMRWGVFDLVDEVWDDGNALIVKNGGHEDRIELSDISHVRYSVIINPPRVTLSLRKPSRWGSEITFCAPLQLVPFSKSQIINEMIERTDARRGGSSPNQAATGRVA